jgi:hypothetical protein
VLQMGKLLKKIRKFRPRQFQDPLKLPVEKIKEAKIREKF